MKTKRQGLVTSTKELFDMYNKILEENLNFCRDLGGNIFGKALQMKVQLNIVNRTGYSDTWEFEKKRKVKS